MTDCTLEWLSQLFMLPCPFPVVLSAKRYVDISIIVLYESRVCVRVCMAQRKASIFC